MQIDFQRQLVLVAEDDYFVASTVVQALQAANAIVIGPCASIADAERLAATSQMAVLDVDLRGQSVFPLAERMMREGIPFVFYTGMEWLPLPSRFSDVFCIHKPVPPQTAVEVLALSADSMWNGLRPVATQQSIVELLPYMRRRARALMSDGGAADRLVELALRRALSNHDDLTNEEDIKPFMQKMMREIAQEQGRDLMH